MKIMKGILTVVAIMLAVVCVSCDAMPDSETEKKIEGTWECVQMEDEDGVNMKFSEVTTFYYSDDADDNRFECTIRLNTMSPVKMSLGTVTYSGTWYASKSKLIQEIDKGSVKVSLNKMIDKSDRQQMRLELLRDLHNEDYTEGGAIISISDNEFTLRDEIENDIYEYRRIN